MEQVSERNSNCISVKANDLSTDSSVLIELLPIDQFDSDGLFKLEHYFGYAARLKLDSFIAPTDQGIVQKETGEQYVMLVRPEAKGISLDRLLNGASPQQRTSKLENKLPADTDGKIAWMKMLLEAVEQFHLLGITQQDFRLSQLLVDGHAPKLICPDLRLFSKPECRDDAWSLAFVKSASPELLGLIEHDVNNRSDIYSLGVVFFGLLTGNLPFDGTNMSQVLSAHMTKQIEANKQDQSTLMRVVARMLEKIPHERYQTVSSIIEDLDWLVENESNPEVNEFVAGRNETRDSIDVPVFVGRKTERDQIRNLIDEVRDGANRILLVKGESGIGKTRLVSEAIDQASQLGLQTFQSEAIEYADQQALAPLTKLINNLIHHRLADSLAEKLDDAHEEIHFFFPKFAESIGLRAPEVSVTPNDIARSIEPDQADLFEANRLSRAVCSILSKLSSPHAPAVVWIDDCQWLDSGTIETLRELARWETESLLIVLSARTSREQPDTSHIDIEIDLEIETGPLSDVELTTLIDSMAVALPNRAVETVVRLASGSPFMAEAILRKMVETGALIFQHSQWTVDEEQLNRIQASSDATEVLLNRIEHFPPKVLEHLSIAAIIGKAFHSSTASAISGSTNAETQRHLDWARRHRLIWIRPDGTHAFVHDRIRLAMVEQLTPARKIALHTQLAEFFEANDSDPIKIATHYDNANLPQRALAPALKAAARAYEASSFSTALRMYRIAWNGISPDNRKRRSQVAEQIGSVLMLAGKYADSDRWFARAEANTDSELYRSRVVMQRSELAFKRGDKRLAVKMLEDEMKLLNISIPKSWLMIQVCVIRELIVQFSHSVFPSVFLHRKKEARKRDRMIWKMYSRLAHCYWYTKSKSTVLWAHLAGLNRAETGPPSRELAQAWSEHAPVMGLIPWYTRGAEYSARSLKVRRDLNDHWGEGQSRNYFSILLYATSRYENCIAQAKKAEKILMRTGDYWELNIARYQWAASLYRQGNLKEAYELALKTRRDAIKIGDHQSSGNIIDLIARASLGKIPYEYIETEKDRDLDDLQLQPQLLLSEGVYHLNNDADPSAAISCFERALHIVKKTGVSNCYTSANAPWLATALRERIEYERETKTVTASSFERHFQAAKRAVRIAKRFQNDLPHALREMGYAWANRNDQKRSRECLLRSLKLAQAQNARYEAALTRQAFERMDARYGWREVSDENQVGNHEVREIEATVRLNAPRETVSIVNRFDALLDAGRKITTSLGKRDILKNTVDSAEEMLRGQTTLIILPDAQNGWQAWNSEEPFDTNVVLEAVAAREPVVHEQECIDGQNKSENRAASVLCCPIVAGKDVVACIYISNRLIKSMFGANEIRIAEFIGNAAGSSLEKESSFRELDELNACLEQKVSVRTMSLRTRTKELELTAQQLRATQHRLESAAQAAESANQIKSDFLAKMSHEIRTPITAVLGFTQLILRGIISEPAQQRKKIKSIESSGKHLLQLVNDLLDISKIEADKIEIERIECRPLHLFSEIIESLRSKAAENNNDLKLEIVAPIPSTIQSDPKRLRQVVTNILGNAIKFTNDGLVTLRVAFEDDAENGKLKLDVIDTGIGMTSEQLKNVFDPFVQADSSITRRFGGTGLGLSISQKLTRALGGDIDVISRPGEGSTFSITIDAGRIDELTLLYEAEFAEFFERQVSSEWITADLSGMQILLADDAETNRDLISLVLGDCGASITLAENGQEAVDHAISEKEFDVILMDMQMPVLDGYSAVKKLRDEGYPGPIFALTANSMKGDREKCLAAGCSDYMTKPIDLNHLVKSMAKLCGVQIANVLEEEQSIPQDHPATNRKEDNKMTTEQLTLYFSESDLPQNKTIRQFSFNFFETLERRREEFSKSIADRNHEQLASLAHWLKGTSGTVMLTQLSDAAKEIEEALEANDWEAIEAIYRLIEIYSGDAMDFCQEPTNSAN